MNYLRSEENALQCTLSSILPMKLILKSDLLIGDTELGMVVDTTDGCTAVQGDLDRLEAADRNLMKEMQSPVSAEE